jgi:serine/threonine protein kinase
MNSSFIPPNRIKEYVIPGFLGQGTMGQVFQAHDTELDREVAVKFIAMGEPDARARQRFQREARAIARVKHPNVVTIYAFGSFEGRPYLVCELVDGRNLSTLKKPISYEHALKIALGLSRGLGAAHNCNVLHRDIKPANVIETGSGEVKLLDFGLAKFLDDLALQPEPAGAPSSGQAELPFSADDSALYKTPPLPADLEPGRTADSGTRDDAALTRTGAVLGTPRYLAPEVLCLHEEATSRSDVYSVGVLLYELCSGQLPNLATGPKSQQLFDAREARSLAEVAPQVTARFAAIVDRCLRRDPLQRYPSAVELCEEIERLLKEPPVSVPEAPKGRFSARARAAIRYVLMGGSCVLLLARGAQFIAKRIHRQNSRIPYPGTPVGKAPSDWYLIGSAAKDYLVKFHESSSPNLEGRLSASKSSIVGFGGIMTCVQAARFLGHRVQLTGKISSKNLAHWAGLWMRVDSDFRESLAFDNMQDRPILGTTPDTLYKVILPVDRSAVRICYGILLDDAGELEFSLQPLQGVGDNLPHG